MQFHSPSVVQAVPAAKAEPEPLVPVLLPVLAGVEEDATTVEATDLTGELAAALETGATERVVADEATEEVARAGELEVGDTVMKTPPETDAVDAGATEVLAEDPAAELTAEAGPAVPDAPTTAFPQAVPVGAAVADVDSPFCSRESPGSGKTTSLESTVAHSLTGMLATNMLGKALYAAVSRSMSMV